MGHFCRDCPENNPDGSKPVHKAKIAEERCSDSDSDGMFTVSVGSMDTGRMGKWLVDPGASSHMTQEKELLSDYREFEKPEKVALGDGRMVEAMGVGNVRVIMVFKVTVKSG